MASSDDPPPKKQEKSYLSSAVESLSPWSTPRNTTPKPKEDPAAALLQTTPQVTDHSVSHHRGISLRKYPSDCPPLKTRWFYAVDTPKRKPKLLKDAKPETKPLPPAKKFAPFSVRDSRSIEAGYQRFIEEEEDAGTSPSRPIDLTNDTESGRKENSSLDGPGTGVTTPKTVKVPVNEDFLFDVDIERRELAPVYWLGPIYETRRGTWFYQEGSNLRPCDENLATQLEEGYLKVKPFRYPKLEKKPAKGEAARPKTADGAKSAAEDQSEKPEVEDKDVTPKASVENLAAANKRMEEEQKESQKKAKELVAAHVPGTHRLFGKYMNTIATYQDDNTAWLTQEGVMSSLSATVYQRFAGGYYFSGTKVIRGFTEAKEKEKETKSDKPPSPKVQPADAAKNSMLEPADPTNNPGLTLDERQQKLLKRRSAPPGMSGSPAPESEKKKSGSNTPESKDELVGNKLSMMLSDAANPELQEDMLRQREAKEIQEDYKEDEGDHQDREIEHLILVTHGIGQKLGLRTESVNFIHDVNVLRQNLKGVYANSADLQALNAEVDKLPKNCRIQVLPVLWRGQLDFPARMRKQNRKEHDITDKSDDDLEYPSLEDITIDGVPFVRGLITDLALDILLYQSAYREHISRIVLNECNRIYKLFLDRNPNFNGKVSLLGHSLGSAIFFDILCRQQEQKEAADPKYYHNRPDLQPTDPRRGKGLSFDFEVEDFYALGSPIGLFQMLKGRTIAARHQDGATVAESPMDPDLAEDPFMSASYPLMEDTYATKAGLPYSISSPKCAQVYNIFHPSDPIAYRLEPLISPSMSTLKAQALPYTKKGIFGASAAQGITGIGARVGQSVSGLWSSLSSGIASRLLNQSLGLTSEDIANMERANQRMIPQTTQAASASPLSAAAGTNITSGGVGPPEGFKPLTREDTNEKMMELARATEDADRSGSDNAKTLIDSDLETLYSGFQKKRERGIEAGDESPSERSEAEEKARKLRAEEAKIRALNSTGRVDFAIQESVLDFNHPLSSVATHLAYWADEDVSHFLQSQLLSRHRAFKRRASTDLLKAMK